MENPSDFYVDPFLRIQCRLSKCDTWRNKKARLLCNLACLLGEERGSNPRPSEPQSDALTN